MQITASEFKAKCLKIMDQVYMYHEEVIITKHGKPVAKLVPVSSKTKGSIYGYMKGTVSVYDDLIKPIDIEWDVEKNG